MMMVPRRTFVKSTASLLLTSSVGRAIAAQDKQEPSSLSGQVGVTASSVSGHIAPEQAAGKFTLLQLPRILRNELDMRVIDLNTSVFPSYDRKYLDRLRKASDDAGCILTNLKMNQRGLDMNSIDEDVRRHALTEYKRSIDAAAHLGLQWARPLPLPDLPDMDIHVASYRELADYGAERDVEMLVENFGWMQSDPDSVVKLVKAVGRNIAACPDTGNWNDDTIRYAGLATTFPGAVTCDYKARQLGPHGEHELYDLKRCFTVGWQAGFRGPWCLEHAHADRQTLFRELSLLRDMLCKWMSEAA